MRVLVVGEHGRAFGRLQLAVRVRWPDASFFSTTDIAHALGLVDTGKADVVFAHADQNDSWVPAFCLTLRETSDVPLIVVGSRGAEAIFAVRALEAGADDYINEDAEPFEIVARLIAHMRRAQARLSFEQGPSLKAGDLVLVSTSYEAFLGRQKLPLTAIEFELLHLLMRNRGGVVSHSVIQRALWRDEVNSDGLVKKYVHRLRRKLATASQEAGRTYIRTVHGVGYSFVSPSRGGPSKDRVLPRDKRAAA